MFRTPESVWILISNQITYSLGDLKIYFHPLYKYNLLNLCTHKDITLLIEWILQRKEIYYIALSCLYTFMLNYWRLLPYSTCFHDLRPWSNDLYSHGSLPLCCLKQIFPLLLSLADLQVNHSDAFPNDESVGGES